MAETEIDPFHWKMIIQAIKEQRCVPFLGAGVNVSAGDYRGLPLGGEVARRLVEQLLDADVPEISELVKITPGPFVKDYEDLMRIGLQDLARVALHVEIKSDNKTLMQLLRTILPDATREPSKLLHTLARMPLRLVVTTNYDRLMERALAATAKPPPLVVTQRIGGFSPREQRELQTRLAGSNDLVLYKIHGSFTDDPGASASPVIVSEEDYIEFLIVAGVKNVGVPKLISEKLVDSVLLFLGYGLEDWDFRTIYKVLIERLPSREQRRSFAIQRRPSRFWEQFWDRKNVTVYDVDLYQFGEELERRYLDAVRQEPRP
jgi:hypothetical protein